LKLSPEEVAALVEQARIDPVRRVLAREGNAVLREEWEWCEKTAVDVQDALVRVFAETDFDAMVVAASFVARTVPLLAVRRFAARHAITRLLALEPPPPVLLDGLLLVPEEE
jgi:hypothetical protein